MMRHVTTALIALACGFLGAWGFAASGLGGGATEKWLLAHPEVLPKMAETLQQREVAKRLTSVGGDASRPFPGAVLGNPNGTVTLVEFSDYGCGYCRQSVADVKALIADNPDLKVVVRERPIFQGSDVAARMALAAADQGKFAAFHDLMFAHGPPSPASIAGAAKAAGLDMVAARAFAATPGVQYELANNNDMAMKLGFEGTPSWIVGDQVFVGAVGKDKLAAAIAAARNRAAS